MGDFTGIWVILGSPGQSRAEEIFGYRRERALRFQHWLLFTAHVGGEFIWQTKRHRGHRSAQSVVNTLSGSGPAPAVVNHPRARNEVTLGQPVPKNTPGRRGDGRTPHRHPPLTHSTLQGPIPPVVLLVSPQMPPGTPLSLVTAPSPRVSRVARCPAGNAAEPTGNALGKTN